MCFGALKEQKNITNQAGTNVNLEKQWVVGSGSSPAEACCISYFVCRLSVNNRFQQGNYFSLAVKVKGDEETGSPERARFRSP